MLMGNDRRPEVDERSFADLEGGSAVVAGVGELHRIGDFDGGREVAYAVGGHAGVELRFGLGGEGDVEVAHQWALLRPTMPMRSPR